MNEVTTLSNVFQHHLSWDKRRCDFAASYIIAALKVCTVNGIKIANALDGSSKKESNYSYSHKTLKNELPFVLHNAVCESPNTVLI
jgi:hypothetical protein